MRGPCSALLSLWVLSTSAHPVPPIQCPVGVTIEAALYFKTLDGVTTPSSVASNIFSMTDAGKRTELETELDAMVGLTTGELSSLSEEELINVATLVYGLKETLDSDNDTTSLGFHQLRDLAEVEVADQFTGTAREYLLWTMASLSDQQLILLACSAEFLVPADLPFSLGETDLCYSGSDSSNTASVTTFDSTATGSLPCRQKCRTEGFKVHLGKEEDDNCYCSNSGLESRETCVSSSFHYNTAGLGVPLLSHQVSPSGYSSNLNTVKDSSFLQIGGEIFKVVLFELQVAVFSLSEPPGDRWVDSDDAPGLTYVDHRKWDTDASEEMLFSELAEEKNLVELHDPDEIRIPNTAGSFDQVELMRADSMTILPVFVNMDEQFYPDDPLLYDNAGYIDYEDQSWQDNLAGRPHPGGKWFYHILIAHSSKYPRRTSHPPVMTMIRILDNGTLVHMMEYRDTVEYGRFKVPTLKKNVMQMLPLVRGRESFFLTASIVPDADYLSPETYSKIQAWKMTETVEEITVTGKTSYFEPVEHGETIQVYSEVKMDTVDFLYKMFVAVLDRTSQDGADSRVRLFSFAYSSQEKDYYLDTNPVVEEVFSGQIFTNMHSFDNEGSRYIVISRTGTNDSTDPNTAKIFSVTSDGALSQVGSDLTSPVSAGALVDIKPAPAEFGEATDLLQFKRVFDGDYSTSVQVLRQGSDGVWDEDSNKQVSSSESADYSSIYDVTRVPGQMRVLGSNVRTDGGGNLEFDLFVIPRLPGHQVDQRLRYESQIAVKIYELDRKISQDGGQYLYDLHDNATANVDLYVHNSGSVVTGDWTISRIDTGTLQADTIPGDTNVTLELRNDEDEMTPLSDWRDVLEVEMTTVEDKLNTLRTRLEDLASFDADLLELNAGGIQEVNSSITVENLTISEDLTYQGPHPFVVQVLARDGVTLNMAELSHIYSSTQNNVSISGTTTFNQNVVFNDGLDTDKLSSELSDTETVTVTTSSLLRLVGGQALSEHQVFSGGVSVETDLQVADGVLVSSPLLQEDLDLADIPVQNISGQLLLSEVVLNGFGLQADHLNSSFPSDLNVEQLVPQDAETVNITGTLIFQSSELITFGSSVGLVDGENNFNDHNISSLYENVAWREAPQSLDTVNFDTVLTFPSQAVFTGGVTFEDSLHVTEINGIPFTDYLQEGALDNETVHIGGDKTLNNGSTFDEIFATSFNSLTLDQLVDKNSAQSVEMSRFEDEVTVDDIQGVSDDGSLPTVDGVDLVSLASSDIPGFVNGTVSGPSLSVETNFSTIVIGSSASITIQNKINDIDLVDRVDNIVRIDESTVNITGDKIFSLPVAANDMKIKNINTEYDTGSSSYLDTFVFDDFINTQNPQTVGSGKTFTGNATFGGMFFLSAGSKINSVKIAPLLECWIDINSADQVILIDEPVKFLSLVTDGLNISRLDSDTRTCHEVTDSILDIHDWLAGKVTFSQEVQDLIADYTSMETDDVDLIVEMELEMENLALEYLLPRCPDGSLDSVNVTGDTGLTGITYLTVTMEDMGATIAELVLLTVEEKRDFINHYVANTHGNYLSQLEGMTTFQVVTLTCRLPTINGLDVWSDSAKLSGDNEFCSEESQCDQTFSGDFQANHVQVDGNLQTSNPVFGVSVSSLANQRVSLSSSQSLSGNYTFSQLSVHQSFQGEILYHHDGFDLRLEDFTQRFLKKSETGEQTFTEAGLTLSKLTASDSVVTGDGGLTGDVLVHGTAYDVKAIYEDHFKYDDTISISQDLTLTKLRVTENIVVGGTVQDVDISDLASDLVITGASLVVPVGGGEDVGYTISGTDDPVDITGRKNFTVSPSVSGDILVTEEGGDIIPLVTTDTKEIQFSSGVTETRIMLTSEAQNITGTVKVDGDVEFQSDLVTSGLGGINVEDVYSKYEYDSVDSIHIIKTNFNFEGNLTVTEVTSDNVNGQVWDDFVADTIPVTSSNLETITGNKIFSGRVVIDNDDTEVDSFNGIDLSTVWNDQAFINESATFLSANTFTFDPDSSVDFDPSSHLRARTSLTLVDPEIVTEDNPVFDVAFVYTNSILLSDPDQVNVTGRLIFSMKMTLLDDSSVGSLGKPDDFDINIPGDLYLLDSTNLSFSVGNESHQFAGANFDSELRLTGSVGGYSLQEFDDVLYKSPYGSSQNITGQKTFDKATLTGDMTSSGDVNGLDLLDNLVYLNSGNKTLVGNYSFGEIEVKNLSVSGLLDGVDWDDIETHLFYASLSQNVSANFTFGAPTSLSFKGAVIGDGDSSNGRGTINNLTVESITGLGHNWEIVANVKTAAQAEASILCNHVKTLASAYLANLKVSYYTYHTTSQMANASSFGEVVDMATLNVGDSVFLVAISESRVRLMNRTKTDENYDVTDLPGEGLEVEMVQDNGVTPVEKARKVEVVANVIDSSEVGAVASVALVISDQGAVLLRISGSLGEDDINMTQVGQPIPDVIGLKFIPEISTFFVAFQTPYDGGYRMEVRSLPYPDYYFTMLLVCLDSGNSTLDCLTAADWYSDLFLVWQGEKFTQIIETPHFDALLDSINNKVFLAVSNHFHTSTLPYVSSMKVAVTWSSGVDTAVAIEGNQLLMQVADHDFVLLSSTHLGLLVTGGDQVIVTKIDYQDNTFSEVSRFPLPAGPATQLRRHSNGLVSVLEDSANLVFMKYAGLTGVKLDGTLYLQHGPVLAYTFFNPITDDKVSENLLLTANTDNKLYLYKSKANFEGKTMDIQCRNPEVGVSEKTSQYCDISTEHTMCKFNKKSESCNITLNNIFDLQNGFDIALTEEHNRYRSEIANSQTIRSDLPPAEDMRKLSWDPELASLAEMWAAQCSSEHEAVRKVIIDGEELDYAQNLIAFKGKNDWEVGTNSMKEMVRYWYNEVTSLNLSYISSYTYRSDTEHFTQLAWSRTYKIGCGWTQYVDELDSYPFVSLVVCNYVEDGNRLEEPIYSQGPACNNCGQDYICEGPSGLCIPSV